MLKSHPTSPPTDAEIDATFKAVQNARMDRAWEHTNTAHAQQRLEAMETTALEFMITRLLPFFNPETLLQNISDAVVPAAVLEHTSLPNRYHYVPFQNELVGKPHRSKILAMLTAAGTSGAFFWAASRLPPSQSQNRLTRAFELNIVPPHIGDSSADRALGFGWNDTTNLSSIYKITMQFSIVLIWSVEGYRKGNSYVLVSWYVSQNTRPVQEVV
jgi:hypothetical protein